jgi:hypothetical protein
MTQIEKEPEVDVISLDNIDILSKWRVEIEVPLLDEAPAWLEEGDREKQHQQEEEEEDEEIHPYTEISLIPQIKIFSTDPMFCLADLIH